MKTSRNTAALRLANGAIALALAGILLACGGGGGSPGTTVGTGSSPAPGTGTGGGTTAPVAAPTMTLAFINASGQASNALSASSPLTAKATLKDKDGKVIPNAIVAFTTDNALAVFSPSVGTALTDAAGVASISVRPASLSAGGAGKVTATSTVAGAAVTGEANFSVGATALTLGTLTLSPASVAAYGSTTVSVDVLAGGARYTDQQLTVTFSSTCVASGKATLAAAVPTNNGTATAVFRDQGCASNDIISATTDGVSKPATAALAIAVPAAASVQFSSASPVDNSIVIRGQGGISRTETATLKFKVFDTFGNPLPGQLVSFTTTTTDVHLNKDADNTDQNGEVITTVNSGDKPTTFRVKATLGSGISTFSDSIVVTTGLPVQRAFSLSVGSPNLDTSVDKQKATTVTALIADKFGNPVPDGTPVVFQTNLGAIGSAGKGGCNTSNGGCTVDFTVQNPRVAANPPVPSACNNVANGGSLDSTRAGVATICASTSDGASVLFGKIAIFLSGNSAANVFLNGGSTPLSQFTPTDLGSFASADPATFYVQINDANLNPLPSGTTVAITSLANASVVDVIPATVPLIFPHSLTADDPTGNNVSGNQGSIHRVTLSSTAPKPCTAASKATFNMSITTPFGFTTSFPFKLAFTCP